MADQSNTEYRISSPSGVSKEVLLADAPSLSGLYDIANESVFYSQSSPHHDTLRAGFNRAGEVRPLAVVRPRTEAAVATIVRFCAEHKIPISIRTGGHSLQRQATPSPNGILIDMRALDSIKINKTSLVEHDSCGVARMGGGVDTAGVGTYLHSQNAITPLPWVSTIGYVGWATGGGYGVLSSSKGLGCDCIVGARVVLASGEVVDTDAPEHQELLWAIRGAGNANFGIITEVRIKIFPGSDFLAGLVGYPLSETKTVLQGLRSLERDGSIPDKWAVEIVGAQFPGAPVPMVCFLVAWTVPQDGDLSEGKAMLDKIKSLGTVVLDTVAVVPLHEFAEGAKNLVGDCNLYAETRCIRSSSLSDAVADAITRFPIPNSSSLLAIHSSRGKAIIENPDTSFANREEHMALGFFGGTELSDAQDGPEAAKAKAWSKGFAETIDATGETLDWRYGHFEKPELLDAVKIYGAEKAERLRAVKKRYDPGNFFSQGYPRLA